MIGLTRTAVLRVPAVDVRVLVWLWSTAMVRWHDWHMARMYHDAPGAEWGRRILRAQRWRDLAARSFPAPGRPS